MIMKKILKLLQRVYRHYTRENVDPNQWKAELAYCGENSLIRFPAVLVLHKSLYLGDNTRILEYSRIQNFISLNNNPKIIIGNNCYIAYHFSILNASSVIIGDNVAIASHVLICSVNHGIDPENTESYLKQTFVSKPISIGDGCWIGEKVCILPGVSIGKKCIIGTGSIVTKSIPDYSIAVGNPAKVIKQYNFKTHNWEKV